MALSQCVIAMLVAAGVAVQPEAPVRRHRDKAVHASQATPAINQAPTAEWSNPGKIMQWAVFDLGANHAKVTDAKLYADLNGDMARGAYDCRLQSSDSANGPWDTKATWQNQGCGSNPCATNVDLSPTGGIQSQYVRLIVLNAIHCNATTAGRGNSLCKSIIIEVKGLEFFNSGTKLSSSVSCVTASNSNYRDQLSCTSIANQQGRWAGPCCVDQSSWQGAASECSSTSATEGSKENPPRCYPSGYDSSQTAAPDACTTGANGGACLNGGTPTGTGDSCGCSCPDGKSGPYCEKSCTVDCGQRASDEGQGGSFCGKRYKGKAAGSTAGQCNGFWARGKGSSSNGVPCIKVGVGTEVYCDISNTWICPASGKRNTTVEECIAGNRKVGSDGGECCDMQN